MKKKLYMILMALSVVTLAGCGSSEKTIANIESEEAISSSVSESSIVEDYENEKQSTEMIDTSLQDNQEISSDEEIDMISDGTLNCPFTAKEFEEIYVSKLDASKYDLSSEYISDYEFWQLNVVNKDTNIAIEGIKEEDATSDTIYFYINYGLEEEIFREIVGAFIDTLYPDMVQEEHDSLLDKFTNNYISEDGSYSGIRGEGEINIIMEPWNSLSSNGVKISALKK